MADARPKRRRSGESMWRKGEPGHSWTSRGLFAQMFCSVVRTFQTVTLRRRHGLESTKQLVCVTLRKCEKLLVSVDV